VGLITAFAAPAVFSEGRHREVELALYLAVVQAGALAVPYLAHSGARWRLSRWLAVVLTWSFLAVACAQVEPHRAGLLAILLGLHLALSGLWIWLPRCPGDEKPSTPTLLWILASLAFTSVAALLWRQRLTLPAEAFSLPVLAVAGLNLWLVKPVRARLGERRADLGLLALAFGHLALAVPIALDWRWVGPLWGCFALGMAWAASRRAEHEEARALLVLAWGLALAATLRWLVQVGDLGSFSLRPRVPFLHAAFASGALTAGAWALLARAGGISGALAFGALQVIGGLVLSLELGVLVRWLGGAHRLAQVVVTLTWAVLGALQWLRSLSATQGRRAFAIAGYGWLGIASFKLITADMANVDTPKRALAFLGVGVIFLAAALVANQVRPRTTPGEDT